MIEYQLICRCTSEFEGVFPSGKEFDRQQKLGLIVCPMCDSVNVEKVSKKPKVKPKRKPEDYMVMGSVAEKLIAKLDKHIKKEFENVGTDFAKEARKAAKGKRDEKFYGTTSKQEAKKLLDDGIDLFDLPEIKKN
jgi:hypothetical protein